MNAITGPMKTANRMNQVIALSDRWNCVGDDVVAAADPEQAVDRDAGDAERRCGSVVARPVEQVVLALVTGDPRLDERVGARAP